MKTKLISDLLRDSIHNQVEHEFTNAHIYLFLGGFMRNKGFDKLAELFEEQYKEELEHVGILYKLLTDMNTYFSIPSIQTIDFPINTIMDIANLYVEREIKTTQSLNEIKMLASGENPIVEERIRQMITLQQKEMEESTTFFDNAELCGNDWWKVKVWSDSL